MNLILRKRIFRGIPIFLILLLFYYIIRLSTSYLRSGTVGLKRNFRLVQDFQKVGNGSDKLYVYSAYCVLNQENADDPCYIIIIGGLLSKMKPIFCKLYSEEGEHFHTAKASLKPLKSDDHMFDLPYVPYYIVCGKNGVDGYTAAYVSIMESQLDETATNILQIKYNENSEKYKFAVCVQPTFQYDDPLQFLEWAEYHRLMGVEKFTMYNMSIGPKTSCLIRSYGDLFEVHPWTSPYEDEVEIRVNGQFIASHDCLTRYKGVAEYLIVVDLDEMIMPAPMVGDNYSEMMSTLTHALRTQNATISQVSGYVFTTRFFFDFYGNDKTTKFWTIEGNKKAENILKKLVLSRKSIYTEYTNGYKPDKYIVIPDKAVEIAAHTIHQGIEGTRTMSVPFEMGNNHHYRMCSLGNNYNVHQVRLCKNGIRNNDSSGQRFGKRVAINVADRLYNKAKECNLGKRLDL